MKSKKLPPASGKKPVSEFTQLLRSFTAAYREQDRVNARRLIDRAWRLTPENPEVNFLYGRLELEENVFDRAIARLRTAATLRAIPEYEATYISALCRDAQIELARQRVIAALRKFAVVPGGLLAQAARHLALITPHPEYHGWAAVGPDLKPHGEIFGQAGIVELEIASASHGPALHRIKCDGHGTCTPFALDEIRYQDHLTVSLHKRTLFGGKLDPRPDFGLDGRLTLTGNRISGWVTLRWDPSRQLEIAISCDSGIGTSLVTTPDPTQLDRQLFSFDPPAGEKIGNSFSVSVTLPDGSVTELPASPFILRPPPPPTPRRDKARVETMERVTDIVIPVYSGLDETLDCIQSVFTTAGPDAEIIVVDDASPDPEISAALDGLAAEGKITLLRNPVNLGFPGAANRGMSLHPDRDVVLLNADTEVYGNWLKRICVVADSDPKIATITPLTNSGSIATYPASEIPDLPTDLSAAYDHLAATINQGMTVEIPTGVGFCLYIRRSCIDQIGYFDAELFGKGYGEENDFCMRAAKAGWKHVLATNIYVRHSGSRSFGGRRAALYERNLRLLNLRYRSYDHDIRAYLQTDPAHPFRRRLDEARLVAALGTYVLVVSLGLEGGVRRAVDERLASIRRSGLKALLLTPVLEKEGRFALTDGTSDYSDLYYDFPQDSDAIVALLDRLTFDRIELHHFLDLPPALIELLLARASPVDIKIHDYVWYCPRVTLLDKSNRYCGEPDVGACQNCVDENGSRLQESITVKALRKRSARWLKAARDIAVPSPSVAGRLKAQFPSLTFRVEPLEENLPPPTPFAPRGAKSYKIVLIGAIGDHKGYETLLRMAKYAARHDLPLDFVVIGFTRNDKPLIQTGKVFITGRYEDAEVPDLIAREKPDVLLFLSVFPESWCYTLSHAFRAGIPVAALDHGAIADRIREYPGGALRLPIDLTGAEICHRLLAALRPSSPGQTSSVLPIKPDSLINDVALPDPRMKMASISNEPTASVSLLPLTAGLFLFSVRSQQSAQRIDDQGGIMLPAMHVTTAPGVPTQQIEFMAGPQTEAGWLREPHDQIVAKVAGPSALVVLTSIMIPGMIPLEIEVQRLGPSAEPVAELPPTLPEEIRLPTGNSIRLEVVPHVQNRGDLVFGASQWAGVPDQGFWIEAFSIIPLEEIDSGSIEYMAITATGVETQWISEGNPCGTRGIGVPLIGFAVRVKGQSGSQMRCEYGAILRSGAVIGPASEGEICRSLSDDDPLVAIWVSVGVLAASPAAERPPEVEGSKLMRRQPASKLVAETATKKKKAPIGPRFSVFRESGKSEQE